MRKKGLGRSFGNTGSSLRLDIVGGVDVDAMKDWMFRTGQQRTTHHVKGVIRKDRNWLEVTTCNLTVSQPVDKSTGALTLETATGERSLAMTNEGDIAITVNGGQLGWYYPSEGLSDAVLEMKLERAPFIDIERERQKRIDVLQDRFCLIAHDPGTFYCPDDAGHHRPGAFSIEWMMDLAQRGSNFECDHVLVQMEGIGLIVQLVLPKVLTSFRRERPAGLPKRILGRTDMIGSRIARFQERLS
ncbi:hypothetical protein F5141DRAFT_1212488 [Pisolithus sp. B1]|nr:hypothetical protein F5141DRAFT_1212488 [Pisolithus sp. B1]